jgi:hypothetical protein
MIALLSPLACQAAEQEGRYRYRATVDFDAFKGYQGIRTDPATVSGVGYVHASQVDVGAVGGDFVAIGTAKGVGVESCADDYDAKWSIYTDGELGGVYFCNDEKVDAYAAGANPSFSIEYGFCPSTLSNKWLLSMGGTLWSCYGSSSTTASRVSAMLETTGSSTVDRNIDVKFTGLNWSLSGSSSWTSFGTGTVVHSPSYSNSSVSSTAFNVYLAPLD